MRVCIIGLGTNWWSTRPLDVTDPFCFRRDAAWFNSAGLMYGNRLRLCWTYPGQIRFNRSSGFNPEFPNRILGHTFECHEPNRLQGRMHLLMVRQAERSVRPDCYLVTLTERSCGQILFSRAGWKSDGVQLLSVSLRRDRYEVMALMRDGDRIESHIGSWTLSQDRARLVLSGSVSGGQW